MRFDPGIGVRVSDGKQFGKLISARSTSMKICPTFSWSSLDHQSIASLSCNLAWLRVVDRSGDDDETKHGRRCHHSPVLRCRNGVGVTTSATAAASAYE